MTRETKRYALKLYDQELMSFSLSYDRFANLKVEVVDYDLSTKKLWPMGMSPKSLEDDIASWAKSRTIPKNRKFVAEILATAGLSANDSIGFLEAQAEKTWLPTLERYERSKGDPDLAVSAKNRKRSLSDYLG